VQEEQNVKLQQVKEIALKAEQFTRNNLQEQTKVSSEPADSRTGKRVLMRDYELIRQHKDLVKEFVFAEMREHAKQLELYCKMFEEVSQKVNIEREFTLTMLAEKRFPEQNIQEFLESKVNEIRGHQKGNGFRAGS
jgi:hypothetical protein